MMSRYAAVVVFAVVVLFFGEQLTHELVDGAEAWRYPTPGPDGSVSEPENWGGTCDLGRRQSPIDLAYAATVKGSFPRFIFQGYEGLPASASIVNNGHTVQINLNSTGTTIFGGGLRTKYILEQLHFHWSSEHTVDGLRYGLELHLVHRQSKFASVAQAASTKGGIAVLAVLFHVNEHPNEAIAAILDAMTPVKGHVDDRMPLSGEVELDDLLPKDQSRYFRYEGSLTTPVCSESVVWTVFTESLPITLTQLEEFKTVHDSDDKELVVNYRSVQPLNARVLVLVSETKEDQSSAQSSSRSVMLFALSAILSIVISYFRL